MRGLVILAVLALGAVTILGRLWSLGFPVKLALKMAAVAAGFVVSVKLVMGGYLALRAEAEPELVQVLGFCAALGLTVFFGVATASLWRQGTSPDA